MRALETRLRWLAISKGVAVAAGVALGATLALVLITNALAFSDASMLWARIVLFLALGLALGYALVIPLMTPEPQARGDRAEAVFPQFQERLLTYVERSDSSDPDDRAAGRRYASRSRKKTAARRTSRRRNRFLLLPLAPARPARLCCG